MLPVADADDQQGRTKSEPKADQQASQQETMPRQEIAAPQQPSLQQKPPAQKQADTDARNSAKLHADTKINTNHAADSTSEALHMQPTESQAEHDTAAENSKTQPSMDVNSQPTAVAAVRHYVKHQVTALYNSAKQMFIGGQHQSQQAKDHEHNQDKPPR